MLQKQRNPKYKILVATDSEKQKRRLMGYLVEAGYRTHCASASELLKSTTGLRVTPPDLVILDLENEQFAEILQQSAEYAKRHGCHILYSFDPRNIKAFKTQSADADLPYIANNCGSHELELGIEVVRLKAAMDRDARERRREQWALQAMSFIAQRSETRENTIDGIVSIVATALDAACSVMTKDARSEAYQNIASAGASPEDIKKSQRAQPTKTWRSPAREKQGQNLNALHLNRGGQRLNWSPRSQARRQIHRFCLFGPTRLGRFPTLSELSYQWPLFIAAWL